MTPAHRSGQGDAPWGDSAQQEWEGLAPAVVPSAAEETRARTDDGVPARGPREETSAGEAGAARVPEPSSATAAEERRSVADPRVEKAQRAREAAVADRPALLRLRQTVIALAVPLVLLMGSIRLIATNTFLWIEYHRPGFPGDVYGFTTQDRMVYGSHGLNYVVNFAPSGFLADVRTGAGNPVFTQAEVEHMTDVKHVILWASLLVTAWAVLALLCCAGLPRRAPGAVRRALFAGGWLTLVLILVLIVLAALGFEQFFTEFHELFFPGGNWAFYASDSLIRLYPEQFWIDAGATIGFLVIIGVSLVLVASWPTAARRERTRARLREREERAARLTH